MKVGNRVIPNGAYPIKMDGRMGALPTNCASQRFQVFHWSYLVKVPDEIPNEKAASFTIAGQTVFSMIRKLQLRSGERIISYPKKQFDILIDSVYTDADINSFLSKTFHLLPRFDKVVFKYDNN